MREKKVLESTVERYILFLKDIKWYTSPKKSNITIYESIKYAKINKSVIKALVNLKIIKLIDNYTWEWLEREPDRLMALECLDFLLHLKKKSPQALMPYLTPTLAAIQSLTDRIGVYITQNEASLKRLKQPQSELPQVIGETIFSEHERNIRDRVYLAGQIASAFYSEFSDTRSNYYTDSNKSIITIVDDLIEQLNAK